MTSREERERRRQERMAAEKQQAAAERRRLLLGYAVAGVLTLAVVVGIGIVIATSGGDDETQVGGEDIPELSFVKVNSGELHGLEPDGREGTAPPELAQGDLEIAAREAGCELDLDQQEEGDTHLRNKDDAPDYEGNPPSSGDHWPIQLADGAFAEFPDPIYSVHSLEHGRIAVQYSPDLSEDEQLELKGMFDQDPNAMLFFPNPDMPFEVAATAWTQMIGCETYEGAPTLDALRNFRDIYRGQGPENVPVMIDE